VAHEPPVARVLPDAERWQRLFAGVYSTAFRFGATLAMMRFALGIGIDFSFRGALKAMRAARQARERAGERYLPRSIVTNHFLRQELPPITNYLPDVEAIRTNRRITSLPTANRSAHRFIDVVRFRST
jgi:hypothetical protein